MKAPPWISFLRLVNYIMHIYYCVNVFLDFDIVKYIYIYSKGHHLTNIYVRKLQKFHEYKLNRWYDFLCGQLCLTSYRDLISGDHVIALY